MLGVPWLQTLAGHSRAVGLMATTVSGAPDSALNVKRNDAEIINAKTADKELESFRNYTDSVHHDRVSR